MRSISTVHRTFSGSSIPSSDPNPTIRSSPSCLSTRYTLQLTPSKISSTNSSSDRLAPFAVIHLDPPPLSPASEPLSFATVLDPLWRFYVLLHSRLDLRSLWSLCTRLVLESLEFCWSTAPSKSLRLFPHVKSAVKWIVPSRIRRGLMGLIEKLYLNLLSYSTPGWAAAIGGILVVITLFLSMFLLFQHLSSYRNPEEQKFLVGVILMVPCYSIESYVSLVNPSISVDCEILRDCYEAFAMYCFGRYLVACLGRQAVSGGLDWTLPLYVSLVNPSISVDCEILRDCYEAFAMYCFGRYLVACLGGEERTIEFLNRQGGVTSKTTLLQNAFEKGVIKHPFPMNYFLKPWRLSEWFYQNIKIGIVQYMIIKTFTAILAVVLEAFGVYCEGEFKWKCGYTYMAVVLNFSQSWALYCLVLFYAATKDELAHIKPLAKFLMFKSIVFLTWWQGVAIALLYSWGLFKSPIAQSLQFKSSVQDFIICIEVIVSYVYSSISSLSTNMLLEMLELH
ncbi:hypothetical protein ZIOFF_007590 [Zingiber officinale]|uniref:Uncharacterized protein n=1 Tax=Zingiber officinale TaxID=94328 RepID=A0A8J5IE08_ZINOF|nr:hypothetical protein ZIOFF_007590 [Zingiber officinale]